ncbi:TetR/AcrR family transcriptional regulator [Novosphingobium sp.]|uniref:TetR/AcrR family transcriptional regulator n=1 Tax=Novosphingobium sp. TaxID=1874826 RepID=UPI002633D2C0|nr:TetR/AcrR family transcriptional regulator [Novosphingobium sp.]
MMAPSESGIGKRRTAAREDSSVSHQQRRKEIGEAAIRVFNRMGFQRASMTAVAAELNIDRASLYYYISSKEELFDEIVRTVVERNVALAQKIQASDMRPRRKLSDLIIALMSSYGEHYPLMYIYIRENLSNVSDKRSEWSRYMRDLNRQMSDAVIAIIEQGYADKSFRNVGSSKVVAYGVLGIVGWTHRWFRPAESDVSAEEIGKIYAEMVLAGLESPY